MFSQERQFKRTEIFTLVDDGDSSHQRAQNQFDVIFEVIDLEENEWKPRLVDTGAARMLVGQNKSEFE